MQDKKISDTDKKQKKRFTGYLDSESERMFNEIYAFRLIRNVESNRSKIICDALKLLYDEEINRSM